MKVTVCLILFLIGCSVMTLANREAFQNRRDRSAAMRTSWLNHRQVNDDAPGCVYDPSAYTITCQYLTADTMNLLEQALDDVAQLGPDVIYGVDILYSDGSAIPVDVFSGYLLNHLTFQGNNFTALPYELLSNVDKGPLNYYGFVDELLLTSLSKPLVTLPFAGFVNDMYVTFCSGVTSLEEGAFSQYTNITFLNVNDNALEHIGFELLGMTSLTYVDYADQKISSIETGAFADLANLQALFLDNNNLEYLQDGAFDGLPLLQAIGLGGNPFNCTCELQWLKDYLDETGLMIDSGATCVTPFAGPFMSLDFCPNVTTSTTTMEP